MKENCLPRVEWDFDSVPNPELVACCYWEYARESATLLKIRENCRKEPREGAATRKWVVAQFPSMSTKAGGGAALLYHALFREDAFPSPWQDLSDEKRNEFTDLVQECYWPAITRELNRTDFEVFLDKADDWYEKFANRTPRPSLNDVVPNVPDVLFGVETMILQINWGEFSNSKLAQAFHKWVKPNRPKDVRTPDSRRDKPQGRSLRADLKRLAVMRLLHRHTFKEIDSKLPVVWEVFTEAKWRDAVKWYDARREARAVFHRLYPFLKREKPLSWPTKGRPLK
jgi:hypothetical protein